RRQLAAVVCLVVEEMRQRPPERMLAALTPRRDVGDRGDQAPGVERPHPRLDAGIGPRALAPELLEVAVELLVEPPTERDRLPLPVARLREPRVVREAPEPGAVRQNEMVQRPVNRTKERLAIALPLVVRERRAKRVEPLVHPPVVARKGAIGPDGIHAVL